MQEKVPSAAQAKVYVSLRRAGLTVKQANRWVFRNVTKTGRLKNIR